MEPEGSLSQEAFQRGGPRRVFREAVWSAIQLLDFHDKEFCDHVNKEAMPPEACASARILALPPEVRRLFAGGSPMLEAKLRANQPQGLRGMEGAKQEDDLVHEAPWLGEAQEQEEDLVHEAEWLEEALVLEGSLSREVAATSENQSRMLHAKEEVAGFREDVTPPARGGPRRVFRVAATTIRMKGLSGPLDAKQEKDSVLVAERMEEVLEQDGSLSQEDCCDNEDQARELSVKKVVAGGHIGRMEYIPALPPEERDAVQEVEWLEEALALEGGLSQEAFQRGGPWCRFREAALFVIQLMESCVKVFGDNEEFLVQGAAWPVVGMVLAGRPSLGALQRGGPRRVFRAAVVPDVLLPAHSGKGAALLAAFASKGISAMSSELWMLLMLLILPVHVAAVFLLFFFSSLGMKCLRLAEGWQVAVAETMQLPSSRAIGHGRLLVQLMLPKEVMEFAIAGRFLVAVAGFLVV